MRYLPLLLILASSALAQPKLDHSSPSAISPTGGEITLHGSGLKNSLSLGSIPATVDATFANVSASSATARLIFPQAIQEQFLAIRISTASGISNPLLIAVDELATVPASGRNKSIKEPQSIELPIAIEGSVDELSSQFYQFTAHKGRRLSVDVVANRIGSKLDPLVRLLDANGKELLFCDDDPAIAPDSRFSYLVPTDANYILELRDAAYEGSPEHRYRLRVKETDTPQTARPPIRHYSTTLPTTVEQEPNDSPAAATPFQLPAQLHGAFDKPRDRDAYKFAAKMGDHLLIRSKTRSIGSPCDLFLRVARGNGAKVEDSKSDTADEASLIVTIKEDGTYFLIVEELIGQSGPAMYYQLDVERFDGFSITADTEKLDIAASGQAEFKITATRRDYKGPITLALDSAPDFIHLVNDTIKEDKNDTQLKIKIDPTAPVGRAFSFRIIGQAKIYGENYTRPLSTYPALKKLFPLMHYPPPQLDGEIGLGIKPPAPTTTTAPSK